MGALPLKSEINFVTLHCGGTRASWHRCMCVCVFVFLCVCVCVGGWVGGWRGRGTGVRVCMCVVGLAYLV